MPTRRVFLRTLGCPKNEVDGGVLARHLVKSGCTIVDGPDQADIEIVNTCGFIEPSKIESLDAIWEAVARKSDAGTEGRRLIVTGCLAQRYGQQLASEIREIDAVVGFDRPDLILKAIDAPASSAPACWVEKPRRVYRDDVLNEWPQDQPAPLSAYVKISDGCDNACRFCAIPMIRGRLRSRPLASIVAEIESLVSAGTREIILVAQDTTSWGIDSRNGNDLARLLREIDRIPADFWVRVMYAHPAFLTDRQIGAMSSSSKVVPYLDMPLQHAGNRMLEIMNRHITRAGIQAKIDALRAARPQMALRTTFIVGHPGETGADFEELLAFAEENAFDRMGVFVYSKEEGTPSAERVDAVPQELARERQARLAGAFDQWSADNSVDLIGKTIGCLLERCSGNHWDGRSIYDAPEIDGLVTVQGKVERPGIYNVLVENASGVDLSGKLADSAAMDGARWKSVRTGVSGPPTSDLSVGRTLLSAHQGSGERPFSTCADDQGHAITGRRGAS
jgi:ribosomal protein S12 methylthiotransferase